MIRKTVCVWYESFDHGSHQFNNLSLFICTFNSHTVNSQIKTHNHFGIHTIPTIINNVMATWIKSLIQCPIVIIDSSSIKTNHSQSSMKHINTKIYFYFKHSPKIWTLTENLEHYITLRTEVKLNDKNQSVGWKLKLSMGPNLIET